MSEQTAIAAPPAPASDLQRRYAALGETNVNIARQIIAGGVVEVLIAPEVADGYGYNAEASLKFVKELLSDPSALADFIADFAQVNLSEPLDTNGEYAD